MKKIKQKKKGEKAPIERVRGDKSSDLAFIGFMKGWKKRFIKKTGCS